MPDVAASEGPEAYGRPSGSGFWTVAFAFLMMLAAVATMMLATGVLAAWKDLPGLLLGRLVTGVPVGLAAGAAITYLVELRLRADPKASVVQARTIGTSVTIGALGSAR